VVGPFAPRWLAFRRAARVAVVFAVVLAVALAVGGCTAPGTRLVSTAGRIAQPSAAAAPSPSIPPANWAPCPDVWRGVLDRQPANVSFDCATIRVPQNWAHPGDGPTFDIALVRGRATEQRDRIGSLLINPGGPGASGFDYAVYRATSLPAEITRRFDIVGFDPRGVGRSSPVRCFSDADLDTNFAADPDPVTQQDFDVSVALSRRFAQQCGDRYGATLPLFSTEQAARDLEAIRLAVGDPKLTYLGYSYGTLLGAVYAQLFPASVRALVLDGAIDPMLHSEAAMENQARGFELAFNDFATWCAKTPAECAVAPDARAAVVNALQQARLSPVPGKGRNATAGWVFTAVLAALYNQSGWRVLANALRDLRGGQPSLLFALADSYADRDPNGHYSNLFDANAAVNCTDSDDTPTLDRIRVLQAQWRVKYPIFGPAMALNLICAQWPGKHDPYPTGPAAGAPPVVVIGTTGDPATPYEQAPALAKMLGDGTVVTWQGEGHTAYPRTRCVTDAVDRYLVDLKVPAEGLTCPAQ
jgi:pimeloyl-ACP methyl ester carboxylesterase